MTIKELEERTGMTRANIRYYEEEKLLSPRRLPNGYRDYSEEDAATLEKIRLLRQLHLDIDTIRLVQQGQLTLEQALFSQLNRLESDKRTIDRALEVCRRLEQSGVEYGALEPHFWLRELEKPVYTRLEGEAAIPPPVNEESEAQKWTRANPARDHPWMRWFARGVDMTLYRLLFDLIFWLVIPNYIILDPPTLVDWFLSLCLLVFTLAVEPLWLHFWGYTPGKWIFGLRLRNKEGGKLTLSQGFERSLHLMRSGYGWNLPVYGLVRMIMSFNRSRNGEDCPWDEEEDYLYGKEKRRLWGLPFAVVHAVGFGLLSLMLLEAYLPLHRSGGGLTVEQFCENYNYALQLYDLDSYDRLESDGTWEEEPEGTYVRKITWRDPEFKVENGVVTAVTFAMESDTNSSLGLNWSLTREKMALLAFSGWLDCGLFDYDPDGWVELWDENRVCYWQDYQLDYRGIRITIDTEGEGYDGLGYSTHLAPIAGREHYVTREVTISWNGSERE